jgi:hypothetical protein
VPSIPSPIKGTKEKALSCTQIQMKNANFNSPSTSLRANTKKTIIQNKKMYRVLLEENKTLSAASSQLATWPNNPSLSSAIHQSHVYCIPFPT